MSEPTPYQPETNLPAINTAEGGYPPLQLLMGRPGLPGCRYLLARSDNTPTFEADGYEIYRGHDPGDKFPGTITVIGPAGKAVALLMFKGTPIPDADPANGCRLYGVDRALDEATGLGAETDAAGPPADAVSGLTVPSTVEATEELESEPTQALGFSVEAESGPLPTPPEID